MKRYGQITSEKEPRRVCRIELADERPVGIVRRLQQVCMAGPSFVMRSFWHLWRNRRYLTLYKLFNIFVVNIECLLKRDRLIGLPYDIKLEPTNICNSGCRLCPTGMGLCGREKGKMSFERFKEIIERIKRHTYVLDLSNWGDPLIVPEIYQMIGYAHKQRIWTYLSTNLHSFSIENNDAEKIIGSGLDMLNCSVHAASQETYERYQPNKSLESVLAKIRNIQETKRRLGTDKPTVRMFFVVTRYNEHEIDDFRKLANELGCSAVFTTASLNLRFVGKNKKLEDIGLSCEQKVQMSEHIKSQWLPTDEKWIAKWYQGNGEFLTGQISIGEKVFKCDWPWKRTVINWNGDVTVCCGVFNPEWTMGNVFEEPFRKIWNNNVYRSARRSFVGNVAEGEGQPCSVCYGVLM